MSLIDTENSYAAAQWDNERHERMLAKELKERRADQALCEGCYKSPCACLPDDCGVDLE